MNDLFTTDRPELHGFRLHKLEAYNWGTFNSTRGQVYSVRPNGQSILLIGQNGSGKSTLVDALLTLLVRPVVRNYNVAAGAHKQERDERTYIKGAFGRFSRDEDNRADVQFLRPGGSHYSALLACFRHEADDGVFTVAQVMYLNSEGRVEKIYCFAADERSIADDCAGLTSMENVRQQMVQRGFRATTRYTEYHSWFAKVTGVRSKAMDMFNQTVAVKDIQSLNRFIRDHMLEAKPWGEKVDKLLSHFALLSEAHQSLVRVRRQNELLRPVVAKGSHCRELTGQRTHVQCLLDATDSYFRQQTIALFAPECETRREELLRAASHSEQLTRAIATARDEARRITNEIEQAGGERLRQIPLLIDKHETASQAKRHANARFQHAVALTGFTDSVTDAIGFAALQSRLSQSIPKWLQQVESGQQRHVDLAVQRRELDEKQKEEARELESLMKRQGNLPEELVQLRRRLCDDLRLAEGDVPFAAELIAVKADEHLWESSLEMVLRNFALSLLVPQRHYAQVSGYVDRTRLMDTRGRGQRLVYLRVGERTISASGPPPHSQSLLRKLDFRAGHPLLPWIKAELADRFDFRCCDTIEEFQSARNLALTRSRHVKMRGVRHEKDDRTHMSDPRYFVLGWDNREKRRRLTDGIRQRQDALQAIDRMMDSLGDELKRLREKQTAAEQLKQFAEFSEIDFAADMRMIETLRREKQMIEEKTDTIRLLKQRLAECESNEKGLQAARDQVVGNIRDLERQIAEGERLIAGAQQKLDQLRRDGRLDIDALSYADLEARLEDQPLTSTDLIPREQQLVTQLRDELDGLRARLEPLTAELGTAMNRFLREFPEELSDLEARVEYLDSFLGLAEHIEAEDLPRHEQRFKERLNEKVTQEIGLLNGALQSEATEIRSKIDLLNKSLRQLEYRPGTHMRLEPRPVRDPEITEFQLALKECLAGTFEGTLEADESRYLRIERLITRLREQQRWREKVTDVRRWFDFAAREFDDDTDIERGYYEDSTGQSGGEKAKLAFTILVAAIAYQYDIDPLNPKSSRFHFVVVDEMLSKVDDQYAEFALELFQKFGLQVMIVAPLDAKARVTEPYVGCYLHVMKDSRSNESEILSMTAREFEAVVGITGDGSDARDAAAVTDAYPDSTPG